MTKQLGEPSRKGYANVIFNSNEESDDENVQKNDLDC